MPGEGPPSTPLLGFNTARRGCPACARHDGGATTVPSDHDVIANRSLVETDRPRLPVMARLVRAICRRTYWWRWPGRALPDSHKSSQGPAVAHCFELVVTGQYDDGPGLSIITG